MFPSVALMALLFIHQQSLVYQETCWPKMSQTPVSWCPGLLPLVKSAGTESHGSLFTLKRLGKRQYQETPQPPFWRGSAQRHVIRSLCLLAMAMERARHWLGKKPLTVSYASLTLPSNPYLPALTSPPFYFLHVFCFCFVFFTFFLPTLKVLSKWKCDATLWS